MLRLIHLPAGWRLLPPDQLDESGKLWYGRVQLHYEAGRIYFYEETRTHKLS